MEEVKKKWTPEQKQQFDSVLEAIKETFYEDIWDRATIPKDHNDRKQPKRGFRHMFGILPFELRVAISRCILNATGPAADQLLNAAIEKVDLQDSKVSNFLFLAKLSSLRNWRTGCPICLEDDGDLVVMFRPCGHCVCSSTCLSSLNGRPCPMCRAPITSTFEVKEVRIGYGFDSDVHAHALSIYDDLINYLPF